MSSLVPFAGVGLRLGDNVPATDDTRLLDTSRNLFRFLTDEVDLTDDTTTIPNEGFQSHFDAFSGWLASCSTVAHAWAERLNERPHCQALPREVQEFSGQLDDIEQRLEHRSSSCDGFTNIGATLAAYETLMCEREEEFRRLRIRVTPFIGDLRNTHRRLSGKRSYSVYSGEGADRVVPIEDVETADVFEVEPTLLEVEGPSDIVASQDVWSGEDVD